MIKGQRWRLGRRGLPGKTSTISFCRPRLEALEERCLLSAPEVAGYYTPTDGYRHAIVATADGAIQEVFFNDQGKGQDVLGYFSGVKGVAGYYDPNDGYQHVIVAAANGATPGDLTEIYFDPKRGVFDDPLTQDAGVQSIAAFYAPDDHSEHVIAATQNGVKDISFQGHDSNRDAISPLGTFQNIVGVAGFYSSDDGYRHGIVATADGNVTEIYYNAQKTVLATAHLGHFDSPIVSIGAYYDPTSSYRYVYVATADGNVSEIAYNPQDGIFQYALPGSFKDIESISAYPTSAGDGISGRVLISTGDNTVYDVYYLPKSIIYSLPGPNATTQDTQPQFTITQSVVATFPPQAPHAQDVSPNAPPYQATNYLYNPAAAGLTEALAGDYSHLYAVSLDDGVWRSDYSGPWIHLLNSPPLAYSIAVDPNNPAYLAVGERDGDATGGLGSINPNPSLNHSGLWESYDYGDTWVYTLDPRSVPGGTSQAIPAVAFGPDSTLYVATANGVGVRGPGASSFTFSPTTQGLGPITAVTVSADTSRLPLVWARTANKLLVSNDSGQSWTVVAIPPALTDQYIINTQAITLSMYGKKVLNSYPETLAAVQGTAVIAIGDPITDKHDPLFNKNVILTYNTYTNTWSLQVFSSGNGTGLGGRQHLRAFALSDSHLAATVGQRFQLLFDEGQTIEAATGMNSDQGTFQWTTVVVSDFAGVNPQVADPIHSDIWDMQVAPDGTTVWVSGDGGVFQGTGSGGGRSATPAVVNGGLTWQARNNELHTHHIHSLTVLPNGYVNRPRLAYPTADNDHWLQDSSNYATSPATWQGVGLLGDVNWSAGDAGNPALALLVRQAYDAGQPGVAEATLTAFGHPPPAGANFQEGQNITLAPQPGFDGPTSFQFIQTRKWEQAYPLGDAVMLIQPPVKINGSPVPGPLGQSTPNPQGGPILIRNTRFAASPDALESKLQGWTVERANLPPGTEGFRVSGDHADPVYYVYARDSQGNVTLYKQGGLGQGFLPILGGLLDGSEQGPLFVNPYDPSQLWVLTSSGVMKSTDGGNSFQVDTVLTNLLTGSGKYPLTGTYSGGNRFNVDLASHANPMGTLADLAFNWDNPDEVVAVSPFTGVFYTNGDGVWRDLTPALPKLHAPVSSAGITDNAVYVGTEGSGVFEISDYRNALPASYFDVIHNVASGDALATLRDSSGNPLAGVSVSLTIKTASDATFSSGPATTDSSGRVVLGTVPSGTYYVSLGFAGNGTTTASGTGFMLNVSSSDKAQPPDLLTRAALAFTHSVENYSNIIAAAYQHYMGRAPDATGLATWINAMQHGLTDEQLEAGFLGSPEYYQHAGGTNKAWVDAMYLDLLSRSPDSAGENAWVNALNAGASRNVVSYGFAASAERESIIVRDDYWMYLGRAPGQQEVSGWVSAFQHGQTNENLVAGFIGSVEYFTSLYRGSGYSYEWIQSVYQQVFHRLPSKSETDAWLSFLQGDPSTA